MLLHCGSQSLFSGHGEYDVEQLKYFMATTKGKQKFQSGLKLPTCAGIEKTGGGQGGIALLVWH